ncbi:phenylalanine--tRNA ligase subunit beta [Fructilactobacillus myrtifloralis]|uniref:Phenylalanine--tRNA ligase beta subunit n=1 Tax=Fructilactobacillus myrtifloralis TaxID=2940301 RepID=A0ABY5BSM9_9LACO|nr:phenylalanine--tRNA ligase subunit beta [Fructilactobacillus myrtifloralis]USS85263.1 phenylalanine--tRNA ligase subunit beta [Fructilactobacillus myrtifloralis]
MLLSYDWISKYLNLELDPVALGEKIERTSVEVDSVKRRQDGLKKLIVGEIVSIEKHPDAGHLNICQVQVGPDAIQQIVCGAPNVAVGKKVIVAMPGARVAGNVKIKKAKMRGVKSDGMLCALDEIGFPKDVVPDEWKDGIYFLPDDAELGAPVYPYLGMDDAMLDLDVTPNRGDMLSMRGVVYDLAAVLNEPAQFEVTPEAATGTEPSSAAIAATADAQLASQYHVQVVKNVQVHPSPLWLQIRLWNAGIKPINNVVDVTNYVMLLLGQPLHAYDLNQLPSADLSVRAAQPGEKITTLDEQARELTDQDVVIASGNQPVALAGLMGGTATRVTADTTDVVLEAAVFDPVRTRKMAQAENLQTDASQRFERGVDQGNVVNALHYAAGLLQTIAGGTASQGAVTGSQANVTPQVIKITPARINHVLGTDLSANTIQSIFTCLGFTVTETDQTMEVTVPTRCWDIHIDADLIEEVARIYGYDQLPQTLPVTQTTAGGLTPAQRLMRHSRQTLQGAGLNHAISYSLTTPEKAGMFLLQPNFATTLQWPMTKDHSVLRMNLVSGLLDDIAYNQARGVENVPLYEQGRVFAKQSAEQVRPLEIEHVAAAISGTLPTPTWNQHPQPVDFFALKGILAQYLQTLSLQGTITYEATDQIAEMHPGRTALVKLDGAVLGFIGQVHPQVAKQFKIKPTYVFDLDLDQLIQAPKREAQYQVVSSLPGIKRDVAMLVAENVTNAEVTQLIWQRGGAYLHDVNLFDVYVGEHVPEGKKSLAYTLSFENPAATLQDDVVNQALAKVEQYLKSELHAEIR